MREKGKYHCQRAATCCLWLLLVSCLWPPTSSQTHTHTNIFRLNSHFLLLPCHSFLPTLLYLYFSHTLTDHWGVFGPGICCWAKKIFLHPCTLPFAYTHKHTTCTQQSAHRHREKTLKKNDIIWALSFYLSRQPPPDRELRSLIDCLRSNDNLKSRLICKDSTWTTEAALVPTTWTKWAAKSVISYIKNVTNELPPLLLVEMLLKRHISWCNEAVMEVMGAVETGHILHANMMWEVVGYLWEILKSLAMSRRYPSKNKPHKLIAETEAEQKCEQVLHHPYLALVKQA